jgi:hypothetical protein
VVTILSVLACFVTLSPQGNAQPADSKQRSISNPNAVEGNLSFQTFFDGYGMMQTDKRDERIGLDWMNPRFGITYKRRLTKWNAINVHLSRIRTSYFPDSSRAYEPGDFTFRDFFLVKANYMRYLIFNDRIKLKGKGGVAYRHGIEEYHEYYSSIEYVGDFYKLRDIGASVGVELEIQLVWQIFWSGKCSYTGFLYTYDEPRQKYPVGDGPTKNMLSVQTGLGFRF